MSEQTAARKGAAPSSEELADRIHSAAIRLLRSLRRQDDKWGLSAPRLSALSVVVFGGPVTLGDLARAEQVRPPTMTRLIQALEAEGLVIRTPDADDKRVMWIKATSRGRRLLLRGRKARVRALAASLRTLDKGSVDTLEKAAALLETVARRL